MFSPSTLELFDHLLRQVSVSAAEPNFDEIAATVSLAKRELAAVREGPHLLAGT